MRGVSLDLGRSSLVALDNQAVTAPAERHGRRVGAGDSGDSLLGSGDKRDNLFDGTSAPQGACERQRGAQQHHHVAPGDPFRKLRRAFREFPLESGAEFRTILDLRETAPVGSTHRWHPEQSVGGFTARSPICAASVRTSRGRVHFMLVTSETGRLLGSGLRWQSRHQLMLRGAIWVTVSIWSMRPWHVTQPTPAATCALWVK